MKVDSEIVLLRERIAKLEAKVEELGKRVDSLCFHALILYEDL
jgi:hypothetical protein